MNGVIQGTDAVLSFYKNDFLPYMCAENITINIVADKIETKTLGDGVWKKYTYQELQFTISLSGLLVFDTVNWTGWDFLDNQINFSHVTCRASFTDNQGNVRSVQGDVMVENSSFKISAVDLVKQDIQLQGNGALMVFDGLIPCDTIINTITVTGQTAVDGIAHIAYTFSGDVQQVKYRVDDTGDYIYSSVGSAIAIPGLALGSHDIEIVPICQNGYEGTGLFQTFTMTQSLTCATVITNITITGTSAQAVYTGTAPNMKYRIDGGVWINALITASISVALPVGSHTIEMVPICSNGALGTGFVKTFTISSSSFFSTINYQLTAIPPNTTLSVYKNGTLMANLTASGSGNFVAATTDTILAVLTVSQTARDINLKITNDDTSVQIYNVSHITTSGSPYTLSYSFIANASGFHIQAVVSP